ncbi:FAD-binding oxidoreductase [Wenzhouxiangella sp. XN24]|uniref:FAD-binding oxidoreductase n=1 Tax=Wenzhouxiangella sp. XN24 TaxID=2713569 RepID=UPI0013EB019F|nr:FAD-binding oxidoreductase [Wenzhouxiangella sp. XN24]NGX16915.1 ferredoxin--NADP reductase [Wenzhouxiangella sp. XN24]
MAIEKFPVRFAWRRMATPHVMHLAFRRSDETPLDFVPGQFLNLHFDTATGSTHRSYSIANPPDADGLLEIAMSPVAGGLATDVLGTLEPGQELLASGPFGRFVLREEPPCRYLLVGTGTGITPYRSMLPLIRERLGEGCRFHVALGVWRREELLFGDDFLRVAEDSPGFEFTACYSREFPEQPEAWEHAGYVQTLFSSLELDPAADTVYLCGNPGMIDESVEILKAMDFTLKQLRREKYVSARPAA